MIKIINGVKYYPFNGEKNQHKLYNAYDRARNLIDDMDCGELEYNEAEYDKATDLVDKLEELIDKVTGGICYLKGSDLALAKDISLAYDLRGDSRGYWRS